MARRRVRARRALARRCGSTAVRPPLSAVSQVAESQSPIDVPAAVPAPPCSVSFPPSRSRMRVMNPTARFGRTTPRSCSAQPRSAASRSGRAAPAWPPSPWSSPCRPCAATCPASGATGAPTPGARATRRSTRSTPATSTSSRSRGRGTPAPSAPTSTTAPRRSTRTAASSRWPPRVASTMAIDPETGETLWMWRLDEGIRWQKAPRQFAGRGLAYWTDGARGARDRRDAGLPHGLARREDRPPRSEVRQERHRGPAWTGSACRSCRSRSTTPVRSSSPTPRRRAARGPARRGTRSTKTGADGTVGIDPAYGQIANSSPAIIVGDVIVVGNSSIHGYYPIRVRNLPGYIRGFDVRTGKQLWKFNLVPQPGEFGAETWKNGSKIGTEGVGKNDAWAHLLGRSGARARVHPRRHAAHGRVRRPPPRRQPVRQQPRRARREDGRSGSGTSRWCTTTSGTTTRRWRPTSWTSRWTAACARSSRRPPSRGGCTPSTARPASRSGRSSETPVLQSEVPGEKTSPTQPIPTQARAVRAAGARGESDLIDYTPAIKDSALKLAKTLPHGAVLHPGVAGRRLHAERAHLLLVRARRVRWREHRRRRGGRSGDGHAVRGLAERAQHDRAAEGSVQRVPTTARRATTAASSARSIRRRATRRRTSRGGGFEGARPAR